MARRIYSQKPEPEPETGYLMARYLFNNNLQDEVAYGSDLIAPDALPIYSHVGLTIDGSGGLISQTRRYGLLCDTYLSSYGLNTPFNVDNTWQSFTIMFVAKFGSQKATYPNVFDTGHADPSGGANFQFVSNLWGFGFANMNVGDNAYVSTGDLSGWHKIACVVRRSDRFVGLYLDNALVSQGVTTNDLSWAPNPFKIGVCWNWANDRYFVGNLSQFDIYKGELEHNVILDLMSNMTIPSMYQQAEIIK